MTMIDDADSFDRRGGKKKADWFGAVNGLIIVLFVTVKKDLSQSSRFLSPVVKRNKTSQALLFLR